MGSQTVTDTLLDKIRKMRTELPAQIAADIVSVDPAYELLNAALSMMEPHIEKARRAGALACADRMPRHLNPHDRRGCTPTLAQAWYEGWDSAVDNA